MSRIERLQAIFDEVCQADPADRERLSQERCGEDSELLLSLRRLLDADARSVAEPWISRPVAPEAAAEALGIGEDPIPQPSAIGGYRIVRELGAGAFGVVYLGERHEPFHQFVAIKVIKPGMDSRAVLSRFARERQALALLDHPGIVRIFDAGRTPENYSYFVMEHVDGVSLTRHCRDSNLGLGETIGLFISVCEAIQFAHVKGVIHRDLKPQNVLVGRTGGTHVAKVIDFGVARLLEGDRTPSETLGPELVIGTPQYMSPEQARFGHKRIDTRTDVYGLSAILYELLIGRPPIDPRDLADRSTPERLAVVASHVSVEPDALRRGGGCEERFLWRGEPRPRLQELDWIVMRGLRNEPDARYQSVGELVADLQRVLRNEPVSAGPERGWYRTRKFVQRHGIALSAATWVVVGLAALLGQQLWNAHKERGLRLEADAARFRAEQLATDLRQAKEAMRQKAARAELIAAAAMVEIGNAIDAHKRLDQVPPDLRAWEWRLLRSRTDQAMATLKVVDGHADSLSLRSDGKRLAVTGANQDVTVLDTGTMTVIDRIGGFGDRRSMNCVYVETDHALLVADFDGTYRVLDDESHQERRRFQGPPAGRICLTRGATRLIVQDRRSNNAVVLDYATGKELVRVGTEVQSVASLGMMGGFLTAGDGFLRLYDAFGNSGRSVKAGDGRSEIAVSSDERLIAVPEGTGVAICDAATLERIAFMPVGHAVRSVQWGASGSMLMTTGLDSAVRAWDWPSMQPRCSMLSPEDYHARLTGSADGRAWYTGSLKGAVRKWRSPTTDHTVIDDVQCYDVECSSDGRAIVLTCWKTSKVVVLRSDDLSVLSKHTSSVGPSRAVCGPDANTAMLCGPLGVCELDLITGRQSPVIDSPRVPRGSRCARTRDRRLVAYGHDDGNTLWTIESGNPVRELTFDQPIGSPLDISPDGRFVVCAMDNVVNIIELATMSVRTMNDVGNGVVAGATIPRDGRTIAIWTWEGQLQVREFASGRLVASLEFPDSVLSATFVEDRLVTTDVGGHLRIWNAGSFEQVVALHCRGSWLGHRLCDDGTLLLMQIEGDLRRWRVGLQE